MTSRDGGRADAPFGLVGRHLGHSWSPAIHEQLGSAPFSLFEVKPEELAGFVREGPWRGLNVTLPYKRDVVPLADELTDRVRRLGAANTLVRRADGTILADNTDVMGFSWLLDDFLANTVGLDPDGALRGREALVLGTGGAASAVAMALEAHGARVTFVSRRGPERYEGVGERHADAALVVNATPVGMWPDCPASPLPAEELARMGSLVGVLDVIYNPERTGLLMEAEGQGVPGRCGMGMLVAQAVRSSELFQGRALDEGAIALLRDALTRTMGNVALVGMPGVGKSSCAHELARMCGRELVDLDAEVEREVGTTCERAIAERGIEWFRDAEERACQRVGRRARLVIACGGGVVERPANRLALHQNSTVVWLRRPLELLARDGRPVLAEQGAEAIARRRYPLYEAWSDAVLDCTGSAAGDARAIRAMLGL